MITLLRVLDGLWHRGLYEVTVKFARREGNWADRLHVFMYKRVCTPVANWEVDE